MTWTPERHAAVKARCNAATEGPWGCYPGAYITSQLLPVKVAQFEEGRIRNDNALADSAFIAEARTDLPDALAEIERLQALLHEALVATAPGVIDYKTHPENPFWDDSWQARAYDVLRGQEATP